MFSLRAYLENPFVKESFKNLFSRSFKVSNNKFFEFEALYHSFMILELELSYTKRRDHAGLNVVLGLLCYSVCFRVLDRRHWDYLNNRWEEN